MNTHSVDTLLETLYDLSGIRFSVEEQNSLDEAKLENIENLITRLRTKLSPSQLLEKYINGLLSYEEILVAAHDIHFEIPEYLDLLVISFKEEASHEAISILNSLYDSSSSILIKKDNHKYIFLHSVDAITSTEDYVSTSSSIRDTLNMEAMINVRIAFDRSCKLSELPIVYQHTETALNIG